MAAPATPAMTKILLSLLLQRAAGSKAGEASHACASQRVVQQGEQADGKQDSGLSHTGAWLATGADRHELQC
jgi:hypothetical protein